MSLFLAVDIGGTNIRAAVYPVNSLSPLAVRKIPTQSVEGSAFERLCGLIESLWTGSGKITALILATPGPLDPQAGIIFSTPNIPGWENFPLRALLEERFQVPVFLGNDANLAALGEWKYGAGQGHKHVLYLTISTGIGGGVISDNHLLQGARGLAGELGHVTVLPEGPLCGCGQRGHLETVASGPAIEAYVKAELARGAQSSLRLNTKLCTQTISQAATQGDALAIQALNRAGTFIGQALAGFVHIFNPSIIIFGGGVSQCGTLLLDPIQSALEQNIMDKSFISDVVITTAQLGDNAGLLGALALGHLRLAEL